MINSKAILQRTIFLFTCICCFLLFGAEEKIKGMVPLPTAQNILKSAFSTISLTPFYNCASPRNLTGTQCYKKNEPIQHNTQYSQSVSFPKPIVPDKNVNFDLMSYTKNQIDLAKMMPNAHQKTIVFDLTVPEDTQILQILDQLKKQKEWGMICFFCSYLYSQAFPVERSSNVKMLMPAVHNENKIYDWQKENSDNVSNIFEEKYNHHTVLYNENATLKTNLSTNVNYVTPPQSTTVFPQLTYRFTKT